MKYPQAGALLQELPMVKVLYITFGSLRQFLQHRRVKSLLEM